MNAKKKMFAYNGVFMFLCKFDLGKPKNKSYRAKERLANDVMMDYLKEHSKKYIKWNTPGFKGNCSPEILNACAVQEDFPEFRKWINNKYKKI